MAITIDINEILSMLPHRYPFLLVDRVVDLDPWRTIRAYKNITFNEPQFQGHFPQNPVMPGVMLVESMGQAGALLVCLSKKVAPDSLPDGVELPELEGRVAYFAGCDKAKFRRKVVPGDRLDLEATLTRLGSRVWRLSARALVDGQKVAEAEMLSALS